MKKIVTGTLAVALSTAAWAGPRYGHYTSGVNAAALAGAPFDVCFRSMMQGLSPLNHVDNPCYGLD